MSVELCAQHFRAFENVAVLIVDTHAKTEVALAVGALHGERHTLRLVALEQNIGIHIHSAVDFAHRIGDDVHKLQDAEAAECLVGFGHIARIIHFAWSDIAALIQRTAAQINVVFVVYEVDAVVFHLLSRIFAVLHGHGIVVGDECHRAHIEWAVAFVFGNMRQRARRTGVERQIHSARSGCRIGKECDIFLIEGEIAIVAQGFGDKLTLFFKIIVVEHRVLADRIKRGVGKNDFANRVVGHIVGDVAHIIWLIEANVIGHAHLFLFGVGPHIARHMVVHVAFVGECHRQLAHTGIGEGGIVDYRRRAHALHPSVEPLGGVLARKVVERQLQFQSAEHLMVFGLAQIVRQVVGAHLAGFVLLVEDSQTHIVEQIFAVGHMLGGTARGQECNHRRSDCTQSGDMFEKVGTQNRESIKNQCKISAFHPIHKVFKHEKGTQMAQLWRKCVAIWILIYNFANSNGICHPFLKPFLIFSHLAFGFMRLANATNYYQLKYA